MNWVEEAINHQYDVIENILSGSLQELAGLCAQYWGQKEHLDTELLKAIQRQQEIRFRMVYVIDKQGVQVSSNVSRLQIDNSRIGQDLSGRPYLGQVKKRSVQGFILSDVYVDKQSRKPCITALNSIQVNGQFAGYIAVDFDLKDLPLEGGKQTQLPTWRQIKGDPSIRGTLFQQTRTQSLMDLHLDEVLSVIESLIIDQGVFHAKLHFSSSRATLWPYSDPYRYRLHVLDEIINPKVCLLYAKSPYPEDAVLPADRVEKVLSVFKSLREADETIYLRAASLNIMNGLVGLNFSCDGSHYMPAEEFLGKDLEFWFGASASGAACGS